MAMTKLEVAAKKQIIKILNRSGYPTYARLFDLFDLNLTDDDNVIGYMVPSKAKIVINKNLSTSQVSVIVRHEILHEYLTHHQRDTAFREKNPKYKNIPHDITNIAADYEISNRGYTDADKFVVRNIMLKDKILRGLVTEDEYQDWIDLSFEEMLERLADQYDDIKDKIEQLIQQIGSEGDPSIQEAEELERQANAVSNDAGEMIDNSQNGSQEQKDAKSDQAKADKLADEADKAKDEIKDMKQDKANNGEIFDSDADQAKKAKIAKRLDDIKKALSDIKNKQDIESETRSAVEKDRIAKQAKDLKRYTDSPLTRFTISLNQFIKNEVATGRGDTWSRFNKKYQGTGLIRAGSSRLAQGHIPLINVYFDRSGSWDSSKTENGKRAIATLNKYVNRGQIKIKLYYFSNNVHSVEQDAINEGGTEGQPILDHIQATKPDNVIILTDSDIHDCKSSVKVPGAVWFLFYQGRSENLIDHLKGLKLTKSFDIM